MGSVDLHCILRENGLMIFPRTKWAISASKYILRKQANSRNHINRKNNHSYLLIETIYYARESGLLNLYPCLYLLISELLTYYRFGKESQYYFGINLA